jgi:hypothetical protein
MSWNSFEMESRAGSHASAGAVWAVLGDVRAWPQWARVCASAGVDDTFDWQPGQRLRFRLRMAGVPVPFDVTLKQFEAGRRVAWQSTEFSITAVRTISTEEDGDGVTIRDHKAFHSPILPIGLVYPRLLIRRMTESWLADLSAEAERRSKA